jgi:hypothetical protein
LLLSPTTLEWLACLLMLLPLSLAISVVYSTVGAYLICGWETCLASMAVLLLHLSVCYSPSVYSIFSWRDLAITLFEEDTQSVGLGIGMGAGD